MGQEPKGYVLKFISGKYQGGEFPLEMDREIIIGRSSELDMVLVEDMVSRQHSKISTLGGELSIEDLGSTNGTFVNGEKVAKKSLKAGDRILVGTSIIKLVCVSDEELTGQNMAAITAPEDMERSLVTSGRGSAKRSISGLIEEVPLPDILQLFSTSKKSGVLVLNSYHEAEIFLRDGRVNYATIEGTGEISPYKAFYRILSWDRGSFALEPPRQTDFDEEMDAATEALLMEGMRQLDEIANLGSDVPAYGAALELNRPVVPPLRSLTPELLDTIQIIHNCEVVEDILNASLATDLETLTDVVYLLRNDYVRIQ
jgi:hypothetical protein